MFRSPQRSLETVGNLNFVINIVKVRLDGIPADIQLIGDLGVADSGSNQDEDFLLPGSQQAPAFQGKFTVLIGVKQAFHQVFAGVPQFTVQNRRHALGEVWQRVTVVKYSPHALFNKIVSKRLAGGHIKNSDIIPFVAGVEKRSDRGPQAGKIITKTIQKNESGVLPRRVGKGLGIQIFAAGTYQSSVFLKIPRH